MNGAHRGRFQRGSAVLPCLIDAARFPGRYLAAIALALPLFMSVTGCHGADDAQVDNGAVSERFDSGRAMGMVTSDDIDEASGLVNSRSDPRFYWTHNDSGGKAAVYLLASDGSLRARFKLAGADNEDWEDIAIGPGPESNMTYLYVGDIGDNRGERKSRSIYRLREPDLTDLDPDDEKYKVAADTIDRIRFQYEDGPRDAEALLVEPATRDLYIVSKREPEVSLYHLPYPQSMDAMNVARRVGALPYTFVTAGDISARGDEVVLKNYQNVYYWRRRDNESLATLLTRPGERLAYSAEPQGEAIAWRSDGSGYLTISERRGGGDVALLAYRRN